ncbi:hypothetical protein GA069_14955 [Vibrio parahaemolyticus]|uniref:hypothetical protein n=1 Tax=Vibrio nigripulchritudo TaxID=28173 RepID=UPI00190B14C2|nr:hypothetical protein [Vibrio nigripulchritudo]EGQ8102296.1 hypothetical protein [Vibrio parahaemolyticus]HAS6415168.1 hypothetical protein [Vibrio vulnificus]EGQ9131147.1 hypothetical protein [Vibrio parahaemolyticus]EGQ9287737.1 hypothetical protein [Vibrio parahaemolyticus]BCL74210.1 hypothetical protein VNTUMSATTG_61470 [Vibrio nigripulchritudo]
MSKRDLNKLINGAASGASLKETKTMATTDRQVRQKKLNNVPASYFDIHKELKASGFTTLNFEAYIMEAIREKFQRDNAI